jgi:hypothetical protein
VADVAPGGVGPAVELELAQLHAPAPAQAAQARALAARIDANDDPGSGLAALSRQLTAILTALRHEDRAGRHGEDIVDMLRQRRQERLAAQ